MRRLIPVAAAVVLIGALVWAFLPRPVMVELAEVTPRIYARHRARRHTG